jgi:hydroxymethylpyrimidine/phosphomethylpyrimidine kinase
MLATAEIAAVVADRMRRWQPRWIVLDPVMVAKSGHHLLDASAIAVLRKELLPLASVVTPNLPEAAVLLGEDAAADWPAMERTALRLLEQGGRAVLLKGGHLEARESPDLLAAPQGLVRLDAERIATANTHGTGCTLSSAIAALLPRYGMLEPAVREAKRFVTAAIAAGDALSVGSGHGPVHHFHQLWSRS